MMNEWCMQGYNGTNGLNGINGTMGMRSQHLSVVFDICRRFLTCGGVAVIVHTAINA